MRALFLVLWLGNIASYAKLPSNAHLELEKQYYWHHFESSDINEYLPHLRRLASECSSVVEIGLRDIVSTWGILQGLSESTAQLRSYLGIDINYPHAEKLILAQRLSGEIGIDFNFWQENDLLIHKIPETDLLFIDSLHTYAHLTYELEQYASQVRKYIALHDTSEPCGLENSPSYYGDYAEYPPHINRIKKGLWPAVIDFLARHPEWSLSERHTYNHGFTVLKRADQQEITPALIDHVIENNIILCTGPSFARKQQLKNTTESDLRLISFKKIFVYANDPDILDITFLGKSPEVQLIPERGHQLDCLNCILMSIKQAALDPDCNDEDIIIFKHCSVFVNDMHLVRQAIKKILEGHNMIIRYRSQDDFFMTNVFYITVRAARAFFSEVQELNAFPESFTFCEDYFTKAIVNFIPNVYKIDYAHLTRKDNELGFFHIPKPGEENWEGYWDKKNYEELYR